MKFGLPISFLAHGIVGGALLVSLSDEVDIQSEPSILVQLASIDDLNNIRASVKRDTPIPEPEDDRISTLSNPMENAEHKGDPEKVEGGSSQVKTDDKKEPIEPVQPPPKSASLDLDSFSETVKRSRNSQPETGQQKTLVSEQNYLFYASISQAAVGEGTGLTMDEKTALRIRMKECWRQDQGVQNPEELGLKVKVSLARDGQVEDVRLNEPEKVRRSRHPQMQQAARNALNAVRDCEPYDFLSAENYSEWKEMILYFGPGI